MSHAIADAQTLRNYSAEVGKLLKLCPCRLAIGSQNDVTQFELELFLD